MCGTCVRSKVIDQEIYNIKLFIDRLSDYLPKILQGPVKRHLLFRLNDYMQARESNLRIEHNHIEPTRH